MFLLFPQGMEFDPQPETSPLSLDAFEFKAILLVDDDRALATTLQWILADENFMVDVAYDGGEAIEKVKTNDYDAIVCDMVMPTVQGDQFYAEALQLKPFLAKRFLFITGHLEKPDVKNFLETERVRFLAKPFPVRKLVDEIKQIVAAPKPS
jgi:CheY-like chemotaxis protein